MEEKSVNFEKRIKIVIGGFVVVFLFIVLHLWVSMVASLDSFTAYAPSHDRAITRDW